MPRSCRPETGVTTARGSTLHSSFAVPSCSPSESVLISTHPTNGTGPVFLLYQLPVRRREELQCPLRPAARLIAQVCRRPSKVWKSSRQTRTLAGPKQGMSNTFTPNNSTTTQLEKMGLSPMNSSFQLLSDGIAGSKPDIFDFGPM